MGCAVHPLGQVQAELLAALGQTHAVDALSILAGDVAHLVRVVGGCPIDHFGNLLRRGDLRQVGHEEVDEGLHHRGVFRCRHILGTVDEAGHDRARRDRRQIQDAGDVQIVALESDAGSHGNAPSDSCRLIALGGAWRGHTYMRPCNAPDWELINKSVLTHYMGAV